MKLAIIAGGNGTRLGRTDLPKPMVPLNGKPILEYQIELAKRYGIYDIYILSGFMASSIIDFFGNGSKWGVNIQHIVEEKALGTAGAIKQLEPYINDRFMVFYGDTIMDINLKKMIDFDKKSTSLGTLLVHPNDHPYDSDLIEVDEGTDRILHFHSKPHDNSYKPNLVNAALYILSKDIFSYIPAETHCDFGKNIFPSIIKQDEILYSYLSAEYIKDMGTPERLTKVEADLTNGKIKRLNNENKRKAIFIDRDGVINKEVDNLCSIEEFELLPEVTEAIKQINQSEFLAIVITNQPVIAKGWCSFEQLNEIHKKMESLLGEQNAFVDKIYYCPHHPDKGFEGEVEELKIQCNCRKPKIGMIEEAVEKFNIDLSNSYFIGDTTTDIKTGINAGLKTFLVNTGYSGMDGKYNVNASYSVDNLNAAVRKIIDIEQNKFV
jgi:mannose-1-phosphate guanylyltransferase / phosphomannomutase